MSSTATIHQLRSTDPARQVCVSGIGLLTPIGLNAPQCFASLRAGIARFEETENYYCQASDEELAESQPLVWSRVQTLAAEPGPQRIAALAAEAVSDLLDRTPLRRRDLDRLACIPVLPRPLGRDLLQDIEARAGIAMRPGSGAIQETEAGFPLAVAQACTAILEGAVDACVVVAADSFLESGLLDRLDASDQLKSARNLDGFIPGEGAAAIMLETRARAEARKAGVLAIIEAVALGLEPEPPGSPNPTSGDGLVDVLNQLNERLEDLALPEWAIVSLNGTSRPAREWGAVLSRMLPSLQLGDIWYPAESLGHCGVAAPAIGFALAAFAMREKQAPHPSGLLAALGSDPQRGVLIFSQAPSSPAT